MNILSKITLKNLKKNKVRTIVTIIGIILSVSMFTAVTTIISSLQHFLVETVKTTKGSYHCMAPDVSETKLKELNNNPDFGGYASIKNIGYAKINSKNEYKPYLFIGGMSNNFTEYLPIKLISGEMPKSTNEIILPEHLKTNGKVQYKQGDIITLNIGERYIDNDQVNQHIGYDVSEKFVAKEEKTYKVVGFYERPSFEEYTASGYTALTIDDKDLNNKYDVYYTASSVRNIYDVSDKYFKDYNLCFNNDLLRFNGVSKNDGFNTVLYGFAGVLIFIIMLGSISLIYNAFSISVSERTKQFGLLKSVGATKKQILKSVIFEALFLSIFGIPLGILAGIGGIGVTLYFVGDLLEKTVVIESSVEMSLYVSWGAVIIAAIIGLVTVLISAYIPAKRAAKKQAIESIRQSSDIKIKSKKLKTSKLNYKLFGFPGMIAKKNYKRNNKKYRATVISLTMSIILFITATTFTAYMGASYDNLMSAKSFDIVAYGNSDDLSKIETAAKLLKSIEGVDGFSKLTTVYTYSCITEKQLIDKDYLKTDNCAEVKQNNSLINISNTNCYIQFVDDEAFKKFLKDNNLDENLYMDKNNITAVFNNEIQIRDYEEQKYIKYRVFKDAGAEVTVSFLKDFDGYSQIDTHYNEKTGKTTYTFENESGKTLKVDESEAIIDGTKINIGSFIEGKTIPMGADFADDSYPYFIMPESFKEVIFKNQNNYESNKELYFKAENHKAVYQKMLDALDAASIDEIDLYDFAENMEISNAMMLIVNVFTYGFIILISLISIANVFNTISTNIALRRREFAMLKSVGMTKKGFNKMMNYECILYGVKSLIYGVPLGVVISLILGRILQEGYEMGYIIPYKSIIIVAAAVFTVVFITCAYSMSKIKKESPIDALKNENI